MVERIISGGQTGADQGALTAAKQLGLATGGWIPRYFRTEAGPCPDLGPLYGLQEHPSMAYPPRTRRNVKDADATVWIGDDDSRGYHCTASACDQYDKPFFNNPTPAELRDYIGIYHVRILNVAGPRASRDPQAHQRAADLVRETLGRFPAREIACR